MAVHDMGRDAIMLRVSNVGRVFTVGGRPLTVLNDINLSIAKGEFVAIVGASGCGKSTLLRLVAGLDTEFTGTITHKGRPITGPSLDRGIVFQEPRLMPWLTIEQNVALGVLNAPVSAKEKAEAVASHISLVGLTGFEKAYPHQLSGGMAQRAALARALANRPEILLLDEPFGALDALTRARLQDETQRIWTHEKITMLLVTHDVDEAVYLADRVIVMGKAPDNIANIVSVDVPRPRQRTDMNLLAIRNTVLGLLENAIRGEASASPQRDVETNIVSHPAQRQEKYNGAQ